MRAAEIGRELTADLSKVTTEQRSKWKSLKTAARSMWDAEDIQKTEKRLHGIREELQLRYLTAIKKKVDRLGNDNQHRMFNALERITSAQGESTLERKEILQLLIEIEAASSTRHDTLIRLQEQLVAGINALSNSQSPISVPSQSPLDDTRARERAYGAILNSLWYPSISDREDSIRDAYAKTFDWLYHDPKSTGKPWDSFVDFLQGDTGSYWITGKPGSGKSTLMKYLRNDTRTRQYLGPWVAGKELLEASFYFHYNGSNMQKSEHGFLLSLLHGLLKQKRDLITTAFEERFLYVLLHENENLGKPTLQESRKALQRLFTTQSHLAFFLTVDGLDEFDPKVSTTHIESLLEFGRSLEEFPNVKIVFASRPLNQFEEAFANCPCLRIHDLTYEDIAMYVNERLEKHKNMQSLLNRDPKNARNLVRSIVESSSGVFLWIRLVVDSLIDGLRNYDAIQDLQRRVKELPTDLYDLYDVMLSRIPVSYRSQTTRLLKIVLYNTGWSDNELSVLGLRFAEEATDETVVKTPINPINDEDLEHYYKEMESRLKSRCLDLVEIRPSNFTTQESLSKVPQRSRTDIYDISKRGINAQVTFLHRSVNEFLTQYNWAAFSEASEANYDPSVPLLRSAILILKTYRFDHEYSWPILLRIASYAAEKAKRADARTGKPSSLLLHTLDSTMISQIMKVRAMPGINLYIPQIFKVDPGLESHWSAWYDVAVRHEYLDSHPKDWKSGFTSFATDYRLLSYLKDRVATNGPESLQKPGFPILSYALFHQSPPSYPGVRPWEAGVSFFLGIGFKHTDMIEGASLWEWFCRMEPKMFVNFNGAILPSWMTLVEFTNVMVILLNNGASTTERFYWPSKTPGQAGDKRNKREVSLLRGARLGLRLCETTPGLMWSSMHLKQLITVLQERGAIEQEWENGVLVYPSAIQGDTDIPTGGKSKESAGTTDTPTDLDGQATSTAPQTLAETSEKISNKAFDGESSASGAQGMTDPSWKLDAKRQGQKDVKSVLQIPTSSKHKRSLSRWLRKFSGRSRSAQRD